MVVPDLIHLLAASADGSSSGSSAVAITLITTAGTVIAAGIAAIAATFRREGHQGAATSAVQLTQDYVAELRRRAEHAETLCATHEIEIERLEQVLLANHLNPETGGPL